MARGKYERHGESGKNKTTEYVIYCDMLTRCYNKTFPFYCYYGGRGITVCDRWRASYLAFIEDVGRRPGPEYTIDRINNNGNYEPGNVRWATRAQQLRNRSDNRLITANGRTMCLQDWANETGLNESTIHRRLTLGWAPENAVNPKKFTGRCVGSPGFKRRIKGQRISVGDLSLTLKEWSSRNGIPLGTITARIWNGWDPQRAVTQIGRHPAAPGEVILP